MNDPSPEIDRLVERWEDLRHGGQSITVEELCLACPEYVEPVRRKISALYGVGAEANKATGDYVPPPAPDRPDQIDGYEILDVLGRGGMGVVYKARQPGLGRIVALKLLLSGSQASNQERQRLCREAEILARLRHPGIVQIHEIGTTAQGNYLVLEYVEGGALDKQIDGKPWPPAQAARLVERIAQAVAAAHEAGIVHRDLKPANILLSAATPKQAVDQFAATLPARTDRPLTGDSPLVTPKVTDFGIAKRPEESDLTGAGAVLGTPSYMSPEQAAGRSGEAGPACDVHALGSILYELLTGRPPFLAATGIETMMQVLHTEPVPPSRLAPKLPPDLETICLKCLEKEPSKRYTAAELAEDLRRFLANEPIVARPAGWFEKLRKWARRNPSRAALYGTLLATLLAAVASGAIHTLQIRAERDRAERNADLALQAVNELLTEMAEEHLALEPRMEEKRRFLLEKALAFYEKLQAANDGNPKLRRQSALGQKRLADILRLLERSADAQQAYARAVERLTPLAAEAGADLEVQRALEDSFNFHGEVLRKAGKLNEAREQFETALRLQEALSKRLGAAVSARDVLMDMAQTLDNLGLLFREIADFENASRKHAAAVDQLRALTGEDPNRADYRQRLARALFNLGTVLRLQKRLPDAIRVTQEAIEILEALRQAHPLQPDYQYELAVARNNLGNYYRRDQRAKEAAGEQRSASELFRTLARDFPRIPVYRRELANSLNGLGATLAGQKRLDEAKLAWEEAASVLDNLLKETIPDPAIHGTIGTVLGNLGKLHLRQKDYPAARTYLERGLVQLEAALQANPDQPDDLRDYRKQVKDLAEVLIRAEEFPAALDRGRILKGSFDHDGLGRRFALIFLARCLEHGGTITDEEQKKDTVAALAKQACGVLGELSPEQIAACRKDPDLVALFKRADIRRIRPMDR